MVEVKWKNDEKLCIDIFRNEEIDNIDKQVESLMFTEQCSQP